MSKLGFNVHKLVQHDPDQTLIHRLFLVRLESVILLREIAKGDHDQRRKDLGDRRIDMELFYEELDKDIIQQQADHHQHKVPE